MPGDCPAVTKWLSNCCCVVVMVFQLVAMAFLMDILAGFKMFVSFLLHKVF